MVDLVSCCRWHSSFLDHGTRVSVWSADRVVEAVVVVVEAVRTEKEAVVIGDRQRGCRG